ncbi:MAG: NAD(P)/FAD-dependent oxidoreductase [Holosporales bacterium]|nr:NAD(P)/FAD-dependent oxidoreductase [Holosporales bacterium]
MGLCAPGFGVDIDMKSEADIEKGLVEEKSKPGDFVDVDINSMKSEVDIEKGLGEKKPKPGDFVDVAIIGAGAAGLYASRRCQSNGITSLLFEVLPFVGGQCISFYSDKEVYGVPGVLNIRAGEFINSLKRQCLPDERLLINEKVFDIKRDGAGFALNNGKFFAKRAILATGIGNMEPRIPIKGATDRDDGFVQHYCFDTASCVDKYADKEVVIVGGGDSALDLAIAISRYAKKIIIAHKKEALTAEYSKVKAAQGMKNVDIRLSLEVLGITDGNAVITSRGEISCDHVVFCCGFKASPCDIFGLRDLGVCFNNGDLIKVNVYTMETEAFGVYAIGDVAVYCSKRRNLVSCFYEADAAVRAICSSLEK